MRFVSSRAVTAMVVTLAMAVAGCGGGTGFTRQYEYEEEVYLNLDGSAQVVVNASLPALVALHGLDLRTDPRVRFDRTQVRRAYQTPVTRVLRVSQPWRRHGRRFVQVMLDVDDIRQLGSSAPFAWARYGYSAAGDALVYRQDVGRSSVSKVANANWDGSELVAFRMHLPSKVQYHNSPSRRILRGNIIVWEQPLRDRLEGRPLSIDARIDSRSILSRTLLVFGSAFATAVAVLAGLIWWVVKKA